MRATADRDRIAFQYASGFRDVLELGVPRLHRCRAAGWSEAQAVGATYLAFLARFPDTHVARKHGPTLAEEVRRKAATLEPRLDGTDDHETRRRLLAWDRELKPDMERVNPNGGASALG